MDLLKVLDDQSAELRRNLEDGGIPVQAPGQFLELAGSDGQASPFMQGGMDALAEIKAALEPFAPRIEHAQGRKVLSDLQCEHAARIRTLEALLRSQGLTPD